MIDYFIIEKIQIPQVCVLDGQTNKISDHIKNTS